MARGLPTYDELQTLLPTLFDQSCEKFMQRLRMEQTHCSIYFVCPRVKMLVCISGVVLMMSQVIAYIVRQICENNCSI